MLIPKQGIKASEPKYPANIVELIGGPGFLGGGHQIATDSKGNIYVAATTRGLQKLVFKGLRLRRIEKRGRVVP